MFRDSLEIENRIPGTVGEELLRLGVVLRLVGTYDLRMGSMKMVYWDLDTGKIGGVTDPRWLGVADGF